MDYPNFSIKTRNDLLLRLKKGAGNDRRFDAVIVGGGIVGAGLARELAIRGVKSLLVEKGDFASGTSSRSSKLIHGGLRYLEMMDFHLVFEALAERHWLISTHPHLVTPLEFNLPIFAKKHAPPGSRSTGALGIGLWLYDALSLFRTPFFHGKHTAEEMRALFPTIRTNGLKGSYYYADAMMLDDEVVLETLLDAYRRGALALNYVKAEKVTAKNPDGNYRVSLKDELTGQGDFEVTAREVIVCVGPWTEQFGECVADGSRRKLKPSKGVHVIVPWKRFPIEKSMVMYAGDGRIIFAIPRKDMGTGAELVIIGTTDSPEHGDLDKLQASSDDVNYLLKVLKEYFPESALTAADIVMTYAGVRPLLDTGEESEAKTSREHEIWRNDAGVVFMAGGKYTTFRKISQELAEFAFPGSRGRDSESKALLSDPADYAKRLAGVPFWGRYTDDWIRWKIEHHMACTLEDVVFRRTPLWMAGKALDSKVLDHVAKITASSFGWDETRLNAEKQRVEKALKAGFNWS